MSPMIREMEADLWACYFVSFRLGKRNGSDEGKGDQYTKKITYVFAIWVQKYTLVGEAVSVSFQRKPRFYGTKWYTGSWFRKDSAHCSEQKNPKKLMDMTVPAEAHTNTPESAHGL